ncbi:MAG: hypothetical protein NHB32_08740 [Fischerella sp. CENA71]|nr:hypothetical protein [Fischerella sp. CENA71]
MQVTVFFTKIRDVHYLATIILRAMKSMTVPEIRLSHASKLPKMKPTPSSVPTF